MDAGVSQHLGGEPISIVDKGVQLAETRGRTEEVSWSDQGEDAASKSGDGESMDVDMDGGREKSDAGEAEQGFSEEQVLSLTTEPIAAPEILFNPSDIGIQQGGIVDAVAQSIAACHTDFAAPMFMNVMVCGGTALTPGLLERLRVELQQICPDHVDLSVQAPEDPILAAWRGGSSRASTSSFPRETVTKAEYEEHGHSICQRKFVR